MQNVFDVEAKMFMGAKRRYNKTNNEGELK